MRKLITLLLLAGSVIAFDSCKKKDDDETTPEDNSTIYSESTDASSGSDTTIFVTVDDRGEGTGTMTWTKNKVYILRGFVFVNSGQTLTIEAGTIIKGESGQGENASALIVARGGKIEAEGTAAEPIIFTSEADQIRRDIHGNLVNAGGNLSNTSRGLWGGLIVLGKAGLNTVPSEQAIEGIPTSEARGLFGGSEDTDNSGTYKYISIRHGGTDIGAGNEINGFTLGGVGSGTTIDYIEVFANNDDGVEFFGGTANTKHMILAYCGDDAIDYDMGYRGTNQFTIVYQDPAAGNTGGEHDGGTTPEDGTPYAIPTFYNLTSIGRGTAASNKAMTLVDNAGGKWYNSVFMNWAGGVAIEKLASGQHSQARYAAGDIVFENNVFYNIVNTTPTAADVFKLTLGSGATAGTDETDMQNAESDNTYTGTNPLGADLKPTGTAATAGTAETGTFLDDVSYRGAVDPAGTPWYTGWTLLEGVL